MPGVEVKGKNIIFVRNSQEKETLGIYRYREEDNIKINGQDLFFPKHSKLIFRKFMELSSC
jgi:hypothetical protein